MNARSYVSALAQPQQQPRLGRSDARGTWSSQAAASGRLGGGCRCEAAVAGWRLTRGARLEGVGVVHSTTLSLVQYLIKQRDSVLAYTTYREWILSAGRQVSQQSLVALTGI